VLQVKGFFIDLKAELRASAVPAINQRKKAAIAELTGTPADDSPAAHGHVPSGAAGGGDAEGWQDEAAPELGTESIGRHVRGPGASHYHKHSPVGNKHLRRMPLSPSKPHPPGLLGAAAMSGIAGAGDAAVAAAAAAKAAVAAKAAPIAEGERQSVASVLCAAAAAAAGSEQEKLQAVLDGTTATIKK